MTNRTPHNFTLDFRSFGDTDVTAIETHFIIDRDTVVFNKDHVDSASVIELTYDFAKTIYHLKNGISIIKVFDLTLVDIQERKIKPTYRR